MIKEKVEIAPLGAKLTCLKQSYFLIDAQFTKCELLYRYYIDDTPQNYVSTHITSIGLAILFSKHPITSPISTVPSPNTNEV